MNGKNEPRYKKYVGATVDELKYFALSRELYKKHEMSPKGAMQKIVDGYCNNQEKRKLIDQVLRDPHMQTIQQPLELINHNLPELPPIPPEVELSQTEKRQVDYLTRKFKETKKQIAKMDGTEPNYQFLKDKAISFFDSRMHVILGV